MNKTACSAISAVLLSILLTGSIAAVSDCYAGGEPSSEPADLQKQAYSLAITGNSHFAEKYLLKAAAAELEMFQQRGYRKADIDDAAFQMHLAYLQAGFAFAVVDYTFVHEDNRIRVEFAIEEGPQVFVQKVDFTGNQRIKTDRLLGFFPKLTATQGAGQKVVFTETEVKDAVSRIKDYYRGEGFVDVMVKKPAFIFNENKSGVTISIQVEEGPQYRINEVILRGDLVPELAAELENIRNNFTGKPYYVRRKLLLRTNLEEAYDAMGYAESEFVIEAVKPEPGKINLVADIKRGEMVRIGALVITGNTGTRGSFIRDRLQMKPGDVYTNGKRRESFRKLYDSGLFAKITIELSPPGPDGRRDLEVNVEELPSREVYVELGWGSYEALRLQTGVFEKNLFGTGRNGRLEGLISLKGETLTLSYTDAWFMHTDISLNVPLYYERREEPSFTSEEASLAVHFTREFSESLTLSAGYQYKMTQLYSLTDNTPLPKGEDDYIKGTVGIQAVWDNRDDIFYPAHGMRLASGFDISLPAFGSDLQYGRITLGWRYFFPLPQEYIIGLRATSGLIIPIGDQVSIPISERFFNGGDSTVRSYNHSELGPKDDENEPVGGLGYNVFSIELRKRFYKNFAATLYADAGNVSPNRSLLEKNFVPYTTRSDLLDDTLNDFFSEFKFGIGIGFQYLLPVGPVRLDIAYNPGPEEMWHEDAWVYHFSLGMAF